MDSITTQINKMLSKTWHSKVGQWLGKGIFSTPVQTGNNSFLAYSSTYFLLVQNQQCSLEYSNNLCWYGKRNFHFNESERSQTYIRGGRSHICRLHQSCKWLSTTGSHRRAPERCSCCTQCPWTGRGICRTLHQRYQISPSPLLKRLRIMLIFLYYKPFEGYVI